MIKEQLSKGKCPEAKPLGLEKIIEKVKHSKYSMRMQRLIELVTQVYEDPDKSFQSKEWLEAKTCKSWLFDEVGVKKIAKEAFKAGQLFSEKPEPKRESKDFQNGLIQLKVRVGNVLNEPVKFRKKDVKIVNERINEAVDFAQELIEQAKKEEREKWIKDIEARKRECYNNWKMLKEADEHQEVQKAFQMEKIVLNKLLERMGIREKKESEV